MLVRGGALMLGCAGAAAVVPGGGAIAAASSALIGLGAGGTPVVVDSFRVNNPIVQFLIPQFGSVDGGSTLAIQAALPAAFAWPPRTCASPVRLVLMSARGARSTTGSP